MSTKTKVWLVMSAVLIVLGLAVFAGAMWAGDWEFSALATVEYETNTYPISDGIIDISIHTDTAHIFFVPVPEGECRVVCYEEEKNRHTVSLEDGRLSVREADQREWYAHIGIGMETARITVYLPTGEYGDLMIRESTGDIDLPSDFTFANIDIALSTGDVGIGASAAECMSVESSTGDITLSGCSASSIELKTSTGRIAMYETDCAGEIGITVSTGRVMLRDVRCLSLRTNGSTGDITLEGVVAEESFAITRSTGDVHFEGADARELRIETDTGDVTGTLLSPKVFIYQTNTGEVSLPASTAGGKCEITTTTGDIRLAFIESDT